MSLSPNYPHRLALMLVALQTDKLPICTLLTDAAEKSLLAVLLTYLDSKDLRTPVSVARKTLGKLARVCRTTLFARLRQLKDKGLLEDSCGEQPLQLTTRAVALLEAAPPDLPKVVRDSFRVGRYYLPRDTLSLLSHGITAQQIVQLMKLAADCGQRLQNIWPRHQALAERYQGRSLYFVLRDVLRQPGKYRSHAVARLADEESRAILLTAEADAGRLLLPGEKLSQQEGRWQFAAAWQAPQPVNRSQTALLLDRMRQCCERHGPLAGKNWHWHGEREGEAPLLRLASGRSRPGSWHWLYRQLPPEARSWLLAGMPAPLAGRRLQVNGVRYLIELVQHDQAALRIESGPARGRIIQQTLVRLRDAAVRWL